MKQVAFVNGLVFNSDTESFEKLNIVCKDGFIVDIISEMPSNATIIDVGGKHLIPGMIDVHTHGIAGFDFNVANTNEVDNHLPRLHHQHYILPTRRRPDHCAKLRSAFRSDGTQEQHRAATLSRSVLLVAIPTQ